MGTVPSNCIAHADHPALFRLVDAVADKLGIARIEHIVVDHDFNASMAQVGVRRMPILTLGLPLILSLAPQERVAVIAHELAHRANGDPGRTGIIAPALDTLARWSYLLAPDADQDMDLAGAVALVLLRCLQWIVDGIYIILLRLLYLQRRKAEFLADYLSATIAGSAAAVTMLLKLRLPENLGAIADRVYVEGDAEGRTLIDAFSKFAAHVPDREIERIRRANRAEQVSIDDSHPPTAHRIEFLAARPLEPQIVLSQEDSRTIDKELEPYKTTYSMRIMARFFAD